MLVTLLVGGGLIHSHFLLSPASLPHIKPAWCWMLSLLIVFWSWTQVHIPDKSWVDWGNEYGMKILWKTCRRFPYISHQINNETHHMKNEREWNAKYQTGISIKSQKKNRSSSYKTPVRARMFSLNLKCLHPESLCCPKCELRGVGFM